MANYSISTLDQLRARLTALVGGNSVFWGEEEKQDAINEALCVWQALTGERTEGRFSFGTDGGFYYSVPHQFATVSRVFWASSETATPRQLDLISVAELDLAFPGWESASTGTPIYWSPIGTPEIVVYPPPPVGGFLTIEGTDESTRLVSGGDFLQLGEDDTVAILLYAHHYLSFKEGSVELNSTQDNLAQLVQGAAQANDELLHTRLYRKYEGLSRDEAEVPMREGTQVVGIRKRSGGQ